MRKRYEPGCACQENIHLQPVGSVFSDVFRCTTKKQRFISVGVICFLFLIVCGYDNSMQYFPNEGYGEIKSVFGKTN